MNASRVIAIIFASIGLSLIFNALGIYDLPRWKMVQIVLGASFIISGVIR